MDTQAKIVELYGLLDDLSYTAHKEQWDALALAIAARQQATQKEVSNG